jgi:fructokinase
MTTVVVVCGEALIDVIKDADGAEHESAGGGPFNTARALARLGVPVSFLGRLSTDAAGRRLRDLLASDGVDVRLASVGDEPTTRAIATIDARGTDYAFETRGTSVPNLTLEMLPVQLGHDVDALHVGTLGLVLDPMASSLIDFVHRERDRRLIMLDPNIRAGIAPDGEYRGRLGAVIAMSTAVKASEADLSWLYPGLSYEQAASRLVDEGVGLVVVTLGQRGAFGAHRDLRLHVPAPHVTVVDTIGAGDAFGAGLLAWLHDHGALSADVSLDRDELEAALAYACRVAAITCTRRGADPPWKRELD